MRNDSPREGRIKLKEKLGFSAFSMSIDATTNFISTFFLFFLTDVFGISPALAGTVLLIGTIWDGINDPLIGYFSINRRFKNGDIARPYAKLFALPTAIVFVLLFTAFDMPANLKFIYAVVIYLLYDTFGTFLRIPSGSMSTLATDNAGDRVSISTFISGGSSVGVILATLGCWPLINALSGVDEAGSLINPRSGFFWGALVAACIGFIGPIIHYLTTKERVKPIEDNAGKISTGAALKMLFSSREWVNNTLFSLFYNFSIIFVTASIVYFATNVLRDPGAVTILLGAYILASMLTLPFVGLVHKKVGRKKLMMLGALILILSKVFFVFAPTNFIADILNGALMGVGVTFSIVSMGTNRAEIADLIEWNGGRRIENMISAVSSTISKLGLALCNFSIGLMLELSGYNADLAVQPQSAQNTISSFMGIIPMAMAAIMLIFAAKSHIVEAVAKMKGEKAAKGI